MMRRVALLLLVCTGCADSGAPVRCGVDLVRCGVDPVRCGVDPVRCGVDVALDLGFPELAGLRVGLVTNATGRTRTGERTIDVLLRAGVELVRVFTPEHGLATDVDEEFGDATDPASGLPVVSLYGQTRRPPPATLLDLDVLCFDVQDAGARFYTYFSTLTLALEAAAESGLEFVVYDRPNPIGGDVVEGPGRDPERESFTAIHDVPVRHGMTLGELAHLVVSERGLDVELTVVPCAGWRRGLDFDQTGLPWRDPSPNLKTLDGTFLYPGVALLEFTNLSVGRGTATPFEQVGAPWIDAVPLVQALREFALPGVLVEPTEFTPNAGPYRGERCAGVRFVVLERAAVRAVRVGLALASALRQVHSEAWDRSAFDRLLASAAVAAAFAAGRPYDDLVAAADAGRADFLARRRPFLMYPQ